MKDFVLNLNQKKNHFKDIESKLMPPICELEEEYELTQEDMPQLMHGNGAGASGSTLKVGEMKFLND